jgi:hypothetical protein
MKALGKETLRNRLTVNQERAFWPVLLVETASTSLQPKPVANHKMAISAKSAGRRSSRDGFSSSTNLKNKKR